MADFQRPDREFHVAGFRPAERELIVRSDSSALLGLGTRIEVYFGRVDFMCLRSVYQGLHVRPATGEEFDRIAGTYGIPEEDRDCTYMLADDGVSFVVSARPAWAEAELLNREPSLFDFFHTWDPEPVVERGNVD
ncbi:hypothetical protein ACFW1A_29525 [Kitasatospora sp. NPDC058965]|uniref:hypothetical protein n=1 Tax=Kitasatospora sp. NPDC058965 TaxID=3346682 RepID=UPI003682D86F